MNELLAKFRAEYPQYADMPDLELAKALHSKFYADLSFRDFATQVGLNTGTTKQPPFPSLPPAVGGTLDFLTALGVGAGAGLPLLSKDTRGYMGELMGRAPGTTAAVTGAGALAPLVAGAGATAAGLPTAGALLARMAGSPFNPIVPAGRSLAARVGPTALKALRGPLGRWLGAGAAGAGGAAIYQAIRKAGGSVP